MTKSVSAETPLQQARARVDRAFDGFIGNDDAVYTIKRSLIVALGKAPAGQPPVMDKTFLFIGAPSVGKTELASRVTTVLGLPFVRLDGRGVRSRERLFEMIGDALLAHQPPLRPLTNGERSGIPLIEYPPFVVFVDEIHLVSERAQEGFLTMLEADDRTMLLDGELGRRIAVVRQATFIFATTKPADLDAAFRSRCIEVQLRTYTEAEVQAMLKQRFPELTDTDARTIASCSRLRPRVAFAMAGEVMDEIFVNGPTDIKGCLRRVMNGRGILTTGGMTRDDVRYLKLLQREGRPVGERVIHSQLHDIDAQRIVNDIEPYLVAANYLQFSDKGRQLTYAGKRFLEDVVPGLNVDLGG